MLIGNVSTSGLSPAPGNEGGQQPVQQVDIWSAFRFQTALARKIDALRGARAQMSPQEATRAQMNPDGISPQHEFTCKRLTFMMTHRFSGILILDRVRGSIMFFGGTMLGGPSREAGFLKSH